MMSLKNDLIRKKKYVVPDCQVHQFAYELMGNVNPGSPNEGPDGGSHPLPGDPIPGLKDAKGYTFSYNIWEDDNLLDDD